MKKTIKEHSIFKDQLSFIESHKNPLKDFIGYYQSNYNSSQGNLRDTKIVLIGICALQYSSKNLEKLSYKQLKKLIVGE